jgi:hypothetical protein
MCSLLLSMRNDTFRTWKSYLLSSTRARHPHPPLPCCAQVNFIGACWEQQLCCLLLEWVPKGSVQDLLSASDETFSGAVANGASSLELRWEDPLLKLAADVARGMAYLNGRSFFDEQVR